MSDRKYLFTSESVSEGHPDKVCDQISDAILDAHIKGDPKSRVACESVAKTGLILLAGEITSATNVDYDAVVRTTLKNIGYTSAEAGCDASSVAVLPNLSKQSPDIAQGVNENEGAFAEQGAGDQGLMFGFACNETEELMPLPISLAHKLMKELASLRHAGAAKYLLPDAKSQVTVQYEAGVPKFVDTVVISTQHKDSVSNEELHDFVTNKLIKKVIPDNYLTPTTKFLINPTGRFVVGGPVADAGLTGRKIIVDTYGGYSRHGGGAFSGKDPTKVDRSAAYAARYVAKNIVAAKLADKCEIQVAYAIGVAEPVSIYLETFGTAKVDEQKIVAEVRKNFSFAPREIIRQLNLQKPIYTKTAAYGHFGRQPEADGAFSWEKTDLAEALKKLH
ncbi:MAG: methionine adenosyltransferase [Proteobacteria bacterium]|nr:methionine adenosyltransferase [Pseudomonadota bacterium]